MLLLRKEADGPAITGSVKHGSLSFNYGVVKIWEKSPEDLLKMPLALLPLVPLTYISPSDLPDAMQRMEDRIDAEAQAVERGLLWTTTWLLLGLEYDPEFSRQLLKGVKAMKESSTYQYTLEEGRIEGRRQGIEKGIEQGLEQGLEQGRLLEARHMLILMGEKRFGNADIEVLAALDKITSQQTLEQLGIRLFEVESWKELLN